MLELSRGADEDRLRTRLTQSLRVLGYVALQRQYADPHTVTSLCHGSDIA